MLDPLLFVICIDDLAENIGGMVSKLKDDIRNDVVDNEEGCLRLQIAIGILFRQVQRDAFWEVHPGLYLPSK